MKKNGLFCILILVFVSLMFAETAVIRLFNPTEALVQELLRTEADIASYKPTQYIDVVANDLQQLALQQKGFSWEITQTTQQLQDHLSATDIAGYQSYDEMLTQLQQLAADNPTICQLMDIGDTRGKEYAASGYTNYNDYQHDIWAMKLSDNVAVEEDEQEIFYFGDHHAREPLSVEVTMGILEYLINGYGTDPTITEYVDNTQIWFVPMVNPNGHKIVWDQDDVWWRKNIRDNNDNHQFDTDHAWGTGDDGVDPNRNYGFQWGFTGASGNPNGETYHGPEPFSEPEIQAIEQLMTDHHFVAGISYHTYGELVLYPYGYANNIGSPDFAAQADMANMIATAIPAVSGGHYTPQAAWELYACMGTTDDYAYGQHGIFSHTVEMATQFIPGASSVPALVQNNILGAMKVLERIQSRMLTGHITDAATGDPVDATIYVEGIDDSPVFREPYRTEPTYGRYHRLLLAGNYNVTFSAFGYEPVTMEDVQIVTDDVTVLDIQLNQNPTTQISGFVRDGSTSAPIQGAGITLLNTPLQTAVTGADGSYEITGVPYGNYTARVEADNFGLMNIDITVGSGATNFDFLIYPADIEDFELGMFSAGWSFGGNADWQITNEEAYQGYFSAQTGSIGNSATTSLKITKECASGSELSFWIKTSSEAGYDFLRLMIDNVQAASWSGETDWTYYSEPISEGTHEFTWLYSKDSNTTGGDDCAWLDYIIFPNAPVDASQPLPAVPEISRLSNYPNPFNPETTICFSATGIYDVSVNIYNVKGQKVKHFTIAKDAIQPVNELVWNGTDNTNKPVSTGIYFARVQAGTHSKTLKMMMIK